MAMSAKHCHAMGAKALADFWCRASGWTREDAGVQPRVFARRDLPVAQWEVART